jgi:hypothetical protein
MIFHNDETTAQENFGKFFPSKYPNLARVNQEDLKHFILVIRDSYVFYGAALLVARSQDQSPVVSLGIFFRGI